MRKFIILCLAFLLYANSISVLADSKMQIDKIKFGDPVLYENVLFNTNIVRCTYTIQDGTPIALTVVPGEPTLLNIVDLNSGKLIDVKVVPNMTSAAWMNDTNSKGDVYFASYLKARLYKYSPVTKELYDLGPVLGEGAVISMCFDDEDNVYMGTAQGCKIIKYDITSEKFIDLGKMSQSEQYLQALAYYDGLLYYQTMSNNAGLHTLDPSTGQKNVIPFKDNTITGAGKVFLRDKKIVLMATSVSGKSVLMLYDPQTKQWGEMFGEKVNGQYVTPMLGDLFYYLDSGYAHSFNMKTGEIVKLENMAYGSYLRGNGWFEVDDPSMPGMNYVNSQYLGTIQVWNFQTQKIKSYSDVLKGVASETRAFAFGPDGRLYVGEYMGTKAAAYDLANRQIELFHMAQPEGITVLGDKVYFGNYTDAELYILDTTKPFDRYMDRSNPENNPRIWGSVGEKQDRPFCMIPAGDKVAMASVPGYGELGGAISIYDPATDKVDVYRNLVPNQMPVSMAYKEGKLYVGTSVSGGLGINPTENDAKVFIFDILTRKIEKIVDLKIPGISTPIKGVEGISIAPDNTIVGYGRSYAYKLDMETLELLAYKTFSGTGYGNGMQVWKPYSVLYDNLTGYCYMSFNSKLAIVDPLTLDYVLTDVNMPSSAIMGPDGHLYYIDKNYKIAMIPVIRGDDHSYRFKNKTVLRLNDNNAIIQGLLTNIDSDKSIVPFSEEDRTMIPVQFLAENMGLKVSYNNFEKSAILYSDSVKIKIQANSKNIIVNGEDRKLTVPVILRNNQLYVQLRTFGELFGRKIYWDDRGIIIYNNDGSEFDPIADGDLINLAESYFEGSAVH